MHSYCIKERAEKWRKLQFHSTAKHSDLEAVLQWDSQMRLMTNFEHASPKPMLWSLLLGPALQENLFHLIFCYEWLKKQISQYIHTTVHTNRTQTPLFNMCVLQTQEFPSVKLSLQCFSQSSPKVSRKVPRTFTPTFNSSQYLHLLSHKSNLLN